MSNTKKIHAELKEPISSRFDIIKSTLGIQNDAEVIRFLIQYYYQRKVMIGKKEDIRLGGNPKEHREIIDGIYNRLGDAIRKLGED